MAVAEHRPPGRHALVAAVLVIHGAAPGQLADGSEVVQQQAGDLLGLLDVGQVGCAGDDLQPGAGDGGHDGLGVGSRSGRDRHAPAITRVGAAIDRRPSRRSMAAIASQQPA